MTANNQNLPADTARNLKSFRDSGQYEELRKWSRLFVEIGWSQAALSRALECQRSSVSSLLNIGTSAPPPMLGATTMPYHGLPSPEGPVTGLTMFTKKFTYATGSPLYPLDRFVNKHARIPRDTHERLRDLHVEATRVRHNTIETASSRDASLELNALILDLYARRVPIESIVTVLGLTERAIRNRLPARPGKTVPDAVLYTDPDPDNDYVIVWPGVDRSWISFTTSSAGILSFEKQQFEITPGSTAQAVAVKDLQSELGWDLWTVTRYPRPVTRRFA